MLQNLFIAKNNHHHLRIDPVNGNPFIIGETRLLSSADTITIESLQLLFLFTTYTNSVLNLERPI